MATRVRAEGNHWSVLQEGGKLFLQLGSIYGMVEVKPKDSLVLGLIEKIISEQEKLVELGPIEQGATID